MEDDMTKTTSEQNKALVLEAFDTLFNKRNYGAAARFWSENYIQRSAHIEPGRDGLFDLIRSAPDTLRYEHQLAVAEGDFVVVHGRFTGRGRPVAWIAADIVRIEDGRLAEHWDVLQDEVTETESKSGKPIFGDRFPGLISIDGDARTEKSHCECPVSGAESQCPFMATTRKWISLTINDRSRS
jgi:predicted SnoaL-like aldol condensation-catalyzing enzyme